jgi:hypothetical protein
MYTDAELLSKSVEELERCAKVLGASEADLAKVISKKLEGAVTSDLQTAAAHIEFEKLAGAPARFLNAATKVAMKKVAMVEFILSLQGSCDWNNSMHHFGCRDMCCGCFCPCVLDFEILRHSLPLALAGYTFIGAAFAVFLKWSIPCILCAILFVIAGAFGCFGGAVLLFLANFLMATMAKTRYNVNESPVISALKLMFCPCPYKIQMAKHVRTMKVGHAVTCKKVHTN